MTPRYYHTPPQQISTRVRCPVCHQPVYSRAGIHPQCAAKQSDPSEPKNKKIGIVPVVPEAGEAIPDVV